MECNITREKALEILKKYNKESFHLQHAFTVENVPESNMKSMIDNDIPLNGLTGRLTVNKQGKVVIENSWVEIN